MLVSIIVLGILILGYTRASLLVWTGATGIALLSLTIMCPGAVILKLFLWIAYIAGAIILNTAEIRRELLTDRLLHWFRRALPPMSNTEKEALEAGTVWWDGELFSGDPNWHKLIAIKTPPLTEEEQAFVNGPTNELCQMLDDWEITHKNNDLPEHVWQFLKDNGFFGMIIPKEFGGKGFSALAHSTVVMKISTRSTSAAVTVMVPNSLGPAELLLAYGTEDQKNHYLPRLAKGDDIPCFALTGPFAGSDAGAIPDYGVVCKGEYNGEEVLGFRVNWEKRYITLGPVATLLGMAFKAYDPDGLLGDQKELGITCALIPTDTPGVEIGRRHFPLNSAFMNGPNWGKDVFIPMEWLIGGQDYIGQGWKMLVNCLSVGRSISLPALSTGAGKYCSRVTGAYARIRKQFKMPVGRFEGVEEALARIAGNAYLMEGTRVLTAGAVDLGEKPSVLSAIAKYHMTERMRSALNDAMDVHGGKGICMGPNNYLARGYQALPISITVEGANILTRSMIIFGQGAMRCHPYLLNELQAAQHPDPATRSVAFDSAIMKHMGFTISNAIRSFVLAITGSHIASAPVNGASKKYYQQLTRMATAFAFVADVCLLILGGALKRKENTSARLGDMLSYLYMGSAALKHFEEQGSSPADEPLMHWSLQTCLYEIQQAMDEVLRNFPSKILAPFIRLLVFPLGRHFSQPNDHIKHQCASLILEPSAARDRLTEGAFVSELKDDVTGKLEHTLKLVIASDPIEAKIGKAKKKGDLKVAPGQDIVDAAVEQNIITEDDAKLLKEAHIAIRGVIDVDHFSKEELSPAG